MKILTTELANWQVEKCLHSHTGKLLKFNTSNPGHYFTVGDVILFLTMYAKEVKAEILNESSEVKTTIV